MDFRQVVREELVTFLDVKNTDQLFDSMFQKLHESDVVKSTYLSAIKQREQEFPTGLATGGVGIALPHTDAEHVNEEAISIGILKNPVIFHHMGMGNQEVQVKIVFMLALQKPENQLVVLQTITGLIQNKNFLEALANSTSEREVIDTINNFTDESIINIV